MDGVSDRLVEPKTGRLPRPAAAVLARVTRWSFLIATASVACAALATAIDVPRVADGAATVLLSTLGLGGLSGLLAADR